MHIVESALELVQSALILHQEINQRNVQQSYMLKRLNNFNLGSSIDPDINYDYYSFTD
jgi:hypothetical protein